MIFGELCFFNFPLTRDVFCSNMFHVHGALVKWLRLRPLTAASGVRIPYASPDITAQDSVLGFFTTKS